VKIVSSLLPPLGGTVLLAMDSLVDRRTLFVGLGQGVVRDGDLQLSAVAQTCMDRLLAHSVQQRPGGAVQVVEIKRLNRVQKRVGEAFATAQDGDTVFFVCGDGAIYDAVFPKLNVQLRPGLMTGH
jgi:hypothetical protein